MMFVNVNQLGGNVGLHWTWKRSLVGANQTSRKAFVPLTFVWMTLEIGTGFVDGLLPVDRWKSTRTAKVIPAAPEF